MTVWFDVEDLFEYARLMPRPSGIQRLSYELYAAAQAHAGGHVGFVRHDLPAGTMRVITWGEVTAVYKQMACGAETARSSTQLRTAQPVPLLQSRLARIPLLGTVLRLAAQRLPSEVRHPLGEAARAQWSALRGLSHAAGATSTMLARRRTQASSLRRSTLASASPLPGTAPPTDGVAGQDLRDAARPGDVLATLGSPWSHPDYAGLVTRVSAAKDLRFALLVYDMIPAVRPEFCDPGLVSLFSGFMRGCLPVVDCILAISEATVRDVQKWAAWEGIPLRNTPRAIPIGTGFTLPAVGELPFERTSAGYALFVSTIEARKNHVLAFRAWRRLLEKLPPDRVPTLVFAGRVGWMVQDLMQQIQNAGHLDGKLVLVENPDDATLAALYREARFTLFPSHYEGWGLPVSESLSFQKVCIASSTTSIPEAGGPFCLYHDPDNVTDALALYQRAIEEPGLVTGLEKRIAQEYTPRSWAECAAALLRELN
jgi:glycosyltransferase involved in cell wall biosynthesis